mmetsp:Transcript_11270/g.21218  ORF Transcript_11270/g.21218 Transcript_11270/m.21218 type:complete len:260 (+) Transcript_11270:51-830(+)
MQQVASHRCLSCVCLMAAVAPFWSFCLPAAASPRLRGGPAQLGNEGPASKAPAALAASSGAAALLFMLQARSHTRRARNRGASVRAFEDELGVQPPLGYFDPLGLSKEGDFGEFYRRREAEIKNGRVAMYATIGYIVPEYFRWPGFLSFEEDLTFADVPNGLQALGKVPPEGWLQIIAWCGMYEILINSPQHPTEPGNYYKGRLALLPGTMIVDPEKRKRSLNSELANGRLAMISIFFMWIFDGLTGQAWGEWKGPPAP